MRVLASLVASASLVAAHGYVDNGTIGGQYYQFYQPYQDPYMNPAPQRIERAIPGNGPVEDLSSIDVQCNGYSAGGVVGSQPAALHADAAAGSTVTLFWTQWPDSHVGPIITYMARCPDTGCQNWQPASSKVWFKVQEEGRQGTSNTWASVRDPYVTRDICLRMSFLTPQQTAIMKAGNSGVKYTIPSCLKPGYYLVRHETIALHASYAYPGAQFYPGCHQLKVSGSGSTVPSSLVSFPGAYAASDPGITYDAYKGMSSLVPPEQSQILTTYSYGVHNPGSGSVQMLSDCFQS
jgi:hypothetical protein